MSRMNPEMEAMIHSRVQQMVREEYGQKKILMISELLLRLENLSEEDKENEIVLSLTPYDAEGKYPGDLISYRGDYCHLSITFSDYRKTANQFIEQLENIIGKTLEGYKGGDFIMRKDTFVFASDWGNVSNLGVIGVDTSAYFKKIKKPHYNAKKEFVPGKSECVGCVVIELKDTD